MCILIDANQAHRFTKPSSSTKAIIDWIDAGGKVVAGGHLATELEITRFRNFAAELSRRGRLRTYAKEIIEAETEIVKNIGIKSDDPHVVALVRISGARVVVTNDNKLIADIKSDICPGKRRAIRSREKDMPVGVIRTLLAGSGCK